MGNLNFINLLIPKSEETSLKEGLQSIPFFSHEEDRLLLVQPQAGEQPEVEDRVFIFCDGSKIQVDDEQPCAAYAFIVCNSQGHILYEHSAYTKKQYNYEAQSILKALHWCAEQKIKQVAIYSDSATDIWHLKNYHTPKYQHKIQVYEEVVRNPQEFSRPKRWRGSDQVSILVEKSKMVEKALRLCEAFNFVSFGYIPRHYNDRSNDLAKELTRNYLNRVGTFVEKISHIHPTDKADDFFQTTPVEALLSYRAHNALFIYQGKEWHNISNQLTRAALLQKGKATQNYDICALIEDYALIFDYLKQQNIKTLKVFDARLCALFEGHINIGKVLMNTSTKKVYENLKQTLHFFDKVYLAPNFSHQEKVQKKSLEHKKSI